MKSLDSSVRRVLIYRLGSLGDTVVALPCFRLIGRAFPAAERRLLTNFPIEAKAPATAAILASTGLVHGYLRYTVGVRNPLKIFHLVQEIRRFKPDVVVYLMPLRSSWSVIRDRLFFRFAGVRSIVGLPRSDEFKRRFDSQSGSFEAETVRLARSIAALGDAQAEKLANWDLEITAEEHRRADEVLAPLKSPLGFELGSPLRSPLGPPLKSEGSVDEPVGPLIVCGPGTKMQAKDWGQENWRALLMQMEPLYPGAVLALVGAREDASASEFVADGWRGRSVNLCGQLSPRETAAVLARAQIFLGPDSGPMHLAASVGLPTVIAFSARGLPGVWFPVGNQHQIVYHQIHCAGCGLEVCTTEARRCLTTITVEEMLAAAKKVLAAAQTVMDKRLPPSPE